MKEDETNTAILVYCGRHEARRAWTLVVLATFLTLCLFAVLPLADLLASHTRSDVSLRSFDTVKATIKPPPTIRKAPQPQKHEELKPEKPKLDIPQEWEPRQLNLAVAMGGLDMGATGDFSVHIPAVRTKPTSLAGTAPRIKPNINLGLDFGLMESEMLAEQQIGDENHIFELTDVDSPPKPTLQSSPEYPYRARRRGVEGLVELQFTVTSEGRVTNITTLRAQPEHTFEESATRAVSRWRFEPAMRNGKAVDVHVQIQLDFKL